MQQQFHQRQNVAAVMAMAGVPNAQGSQPQFYPH